MNRFIASVICGLALVSGAGFAQTPDKASSDAQTGSSKVRQEMKAEGVADVGTDPRILNSMGYAAMYEEKNVQKALKYFSWNCTLFPQYPDLIDSLAEAYLQAGDIDRAIEHYERVLRLLPAVQSDAAQIVAKLKADRKQLPAMQELGRKAYLAFKNSGQKP